MTYKINYLPIARTDLIEIIDYISNHLKAPRAAINLIEEFNKSILRLQEFPYSCKVYNSKVKTLENEYRVLQVKNYMVFYIIKKNEVEIYRVIYSKMDIDKILKL
jgi:plasmid stabilization system protein ParE